LINANIFNALWDARTESVDAVVPYANNRIQGTCAFYNKCILSRMELAINCSEYSLYSIADKLNSIKIEFGNDKRFWNMNTKKDYGEIIKYITEQD
jgi:molybdopterin-guanine dinucleotide biosynthesis protein A